MSRSVHSLYIEPAAGCRESAEDIRIPAQGGTWFGPLVRTYIGSVKSRKTPTRTTRQKIKQIQNIICMYNMLWYYYCCMLYLNSSSPVSPWWCHLVESKPYGTTAVTIIIIVQEAVQHARQHAQKRFSKGAFFVDNVREGANA